MSNDLFSLYPRTQSLSKEDMQDLLSDPAYFSAFFNSLQGVQARDEQLEASLARNQQATDQNLSLEPQLEALRTEAASTFHQTHDLMQSWPTLQAEQSTAAQRFNPETQLSKLIAASASSDKESDSIAAAFQRGDLSEEEFVKQYKEARRLYHRRTLQAGNATQGKVDWSA